MWRSDECGCGCSCPFGENRGTGGTPDGKVVGSRSESRVQWFTLTTDSVYGTGGRAQAMRSPGKTALPKGQDSHDYFFLGCSRGLMGLFRAGGWTVLNICCLARGELVLRVLICEVGVAVVLFTDFWDGGKSRRFLPGEKWDFIGLFCIPRESNKLHPPPRKRAFGKKCSPGDYMTTHRHGVSFVWRQIFLNLVLWLYSLSNIFRNIKLHEVGPIPCFRN